MKKTFLFFLLLLLVYNISEARKIKNSFKVEKSYGRTSDDHKKNRVGREYVITDLLPSAGDSILNELKKIKFVGYEKEYNSRMETFIIVNSSSFPLTGFKIKIDYLDMQGRMLHSREIDESCFVPSQESRKIDIKSWDNQHTYYYHLGNEPKRIGIPYQVSFKPQSFWVDLELIQ